MSEQEHDALILAVVKDSRAAREELTILREQAKRVAEDMEAALNHLRGIVGRDDIGVGTVHRKYDLTASLERLPDGPTIRTLSNELKAAIDRDRELTLRKQELGI
jgi:hypothetical protein